MDAYGNVDYVRLTVKADAPADEVMRLAGVRQDAIELQGGNYEKQRWAWQGYSGYSVGAVSWGSRPDTHYLQISGFAASVVAESALPRSWGCARVDLAATILLGFDWPGMAGDLATAALASGPAGGQRRRRQIRLESTFGRGDTLYLGSRKSRVFARVYDKHRESKEKWPVGAWRYEIEAHNEAARYYLAQVRKVGNQNQACLGLVNDWFTRRGVSFPIETSNTADARVPAKETDSSDTAFLEWLRRQVNPAIQKRIDRLGKDAILEALPALREVR